jgi:hypothetical protein
MQIIVLSFPSALARTIQKLLNVETQRVQFKPLQLRFYTLIKASKLQKLMNIKDKQNNHFKSLKLGHSFNAAKLKRERDYRTPQDRRAGHTIEHRFGILSVHLFVELRLPQRVLVPHLQPHQRHFSLPLSLSLKLCERHK